MAVVQPPSGRLMATSRSAFEDTQVLFCVRNLKVGDTSEPEEPKETASSKTQVEKCSCLLHGKLNKIITNGIFLFMLCSVIWLISGHDSLLMENTFGLLIIFFGAKIGGKFMEFIRIPSGPRLPPLFGMLLAGFIIRNVPFLSTRVNISNTWSSTLRNIALTVILMRAGLGLDPQTLKDLKGVCLRLAVGPCLTEACAAAVISRFLLDFPWRWGFLLGFVLSAVSPAVVVPAMLLLQENGYGIEKGIPTLLIAASSLDDILAITGFNACFSTVFSKGDNILKTVLAPFRDIFIGVLVGTVLGICVRYFPSRDQTNLPLKRASLLLIMCVCAVLGSHDTGFHAAGGLCTLMLTFIGGVHWSDEKYLVSHPSTNQARPCLASEIRRDRVCSGWCGRRLSILFKKDFFTQDYKITNIIVSSILSSNTLIEVQKMVAWVWDVFQPLLFGLVGSEVSVAALESNATGIGVATMSLALLVRIFFTFLLMCFTDFTFKEKLFIALSWMPKATVQAVLGPLALETARISAPHLEPYSKDVMTVAFLAILLTAPNGALITGILGPKVLTRSDPSTMKQN